MDDAVVIGTIGKPHGVHGELRVYPTGPTVDVLENGARVTARGKDADRQLTIRDIRDAGAHRLVRFDEIGDREAAATVVGASLVVDASQLIDLEDEDEFYVRDLIGCEVRDEDGGRIGAIREVHDGAANPSLEIERTDTDPILVPFTHDAISAVDLSEHVVVVRRGLLTVEDA